MVAKINMPKLLVLIVWSMLCVAIGMPIGRHQAENWRAINEHRVMEEKVFNIVRIAVNTLERTVSRYENEPSKRRYIDTSFRA